MRVMRLRVVLSVVAAGVLLFSGCSSSDESSAASTKVLEVGETIHGGLPVPAGAVLKEQVVHTTTYRVEGVLGEDLVVFYKTHAPIGEDLGDWRFCEGGPLFDWEIDGRIWTKPGVRETTQVLELSIGTWGEIQVTWNPDGMRCYR